MASKWLHVWSLVVCASMIRAEISTQYKQAILDKHNDLRRKQGASNMIKLVWSDELAQLADNWIASCRMEHQNAGYGENLGYETRKNESDGVYIDKIIQGWYDEIKTYTYGVKCSYTTSCHYTQLVWYKTQEIGCAHRFCPQMTFKNIVSKDSVYFGCWYSPRGNWEKYPFGKGGPCSNCTKQGATCDDGLCTGGQMICKDLDPSCKSYKANGDCQKNAGWMNDNCQQTCGCPPGSIEVKAECKDKSPYCSRYKKSDCDKNPSWMYDNCSVLCDKC